MADLEFRVGDDVRKKLRDMGDGTHAEVFALSESQQIGLGIVVMNFATNGDRFPSDSATAYTYDESGVNITSITKTTAAGVSYRQTWTRDNMAQLSSKTGWVRLP